jgi:aryl-alcohol dehydrogenase-like predicted oxidoreductase
MLKYAWMGDTGSIVSRLSLGAMTFTLSNKTMQSIYKVGEEEGSSGGM